jgi:predicted ATPase/transcriptional regulator with XRE-family HTH domain/Tfp pilus assembly protein PilF
MGDISFGQLVKQLRKDYGLTQEDFAEQVGCSIETVSKIERGERRPSKQVAERMAQVLNLPPEERASFIRAARIPSRVVDERESQEPGIQGKEIAPQSISLNPPLPVSSAPPAPRGPAPLPVPPTPFVGRQGELSTLAALLADPACRLLTLTGPGGIGKTRLALEAAARHTAEYADGVAFVPLAAVVSAELLAPAIADAVAFTFYGPTDFTGQLLGYLRDRSLLLVLDNMEHLIDVGDALWALLADIGQQAPGVKLLVTSRERLNLQGEWVVELVGLPAPPNERDVGFEESSAVALFLQTARRSHSGFTLAAEDRACVARICRLVEGLPLAIELAAAWVRVLPCGEIAAEIERTLDFLAASARDVPARHRSLRAVVDHSWNLLTDEERAVFRMLSVFEGGFRREAAEWVAGATLPLLTALADKSLLRRSQAGRYDMHELVRQYAAAHLEASPAEYAAARDRHCSYYLTLIERREHDMKRALQKAVLGELVAEMDNLRLAWEWAATHGKIAEIRASLRGLSWLYEIGAWLHEGQDAFRQAAEAIGGVGLSAERATVFGHLLAHQGWFCSRQGRYGQAQALLQRSLALLRPLDDQLALADALTCLGTLMHLMGDNAAARDLLREGLGLGRALGDDWVTVVCLGSLAMAAHSLGEHQEAERLSRECLAVARAAGNPRGVVYSIGTFSMATFAQGRYAEAQALLRESLELSSAAGDYWGIGSSFIQIGLAAYAQGAYATSRYCFEESIAMFREVGDHLNVARSLINLAETSAAMGAHDAARRAFADAWRMANDAQAVSSALDALAGLAGLLAREGAAALVQELAYYVLNHPLSARVTRGRAERLLVGPTPAPARPIEAVVAEALGDTRSR